MNAPTSAVVLLDAVRRGRQQLRAESDLYEFVKQAWHVVEPGVEFIHGWHLELICNHLQAVTEGEVRRLLINIPPRHAKSTIVSVMWPCWEWIKKPSEKFLCASYSGSLSIRDNLKARRLVTSPWYQERWASIVKLTGDQNAKQRFENTATGYRLASSVGGTATGEGGTRLILDDPHGAQDAQSDAMRDTAIEWFDQVWSTRMNDPKHDAMVTIMQRLHENDVSGRILELGDWEHLCLPAEFDGAKRSTSIAKHYDPRTHDNELLWPKRFGTEELVRLKAQLGVYGTAGQLQQRPAPEGGGILRTKHFQLWPTKWGLPKFTHVVQSYDGAYEEKQENDPSACTVWGVFEERGIKGVMLLDAWAERLPYPKFRKKVVEDWHELYGEINPSEHKKGKKPDVILVEKKSSGISILQDLRAANIPALPYDPGRSSKTVRAHNVAPVLEMDVIYIPESQKNPGQFVTWARPFVEQCEKFPNAEHDDLVDTFTQAVIYLRDAQFFELEYAEPDILEEDDYHAKKLHRVNPYG